jgi:5-methylcytosine-specific restriction endonuclease McrA
LGRPGTNLHLLARVARTDATFREQAGLIVGKCLLCNGPVAFDPRTGAGATLEHIRARSRGGGAELENLAVVHRSCNNEKGRNWDNRKARNAEDYEAFVDRLLAKRRERWRGEA